MKRSIASRSVTRGLAKVLIAFAAKAGSTAADGDSANSPFAAALVKYLPRPAWTFAAPSASNLKNVAAGTPINHEVSVRFERSRGTGERQSGRPCHYTFERQRASR